MNRLQALAGLLLLPFLAFAQVETARIVGTIADGSGAVVPGATITFTHIDTNTTSTTVSDEAGRYRSMPLRIGEYRVEVASDGFKRVVRTGIVLQIEDTALVDFALELGSVSETIDVTASAPLLETAMATQGQVIDNRKIVELPLNGRDYIQLALLSSGAVQPVGGRFGGFSSGGQRQTQNNYLLDGVDNNNIQIAAQGRRGEAMKPSVDAVQEFKVLTNSFSAEYGRALGGVVNASIKSGGNEIHGTVFEFLRNERLDAKNFFDSPTARRPPFKRNQFGFSLGGPIQKDKTFIFGDYEGTRIRESRTVNNTIPTVAQRGGDFRDTGITIFDPDTYNPATRARMPFPNNTIPANRIDPIAARAAAWYPQPNNGRITQNFLFNPPLKEDVNKFDVRVDHVLSMKDTIYYRYSWQQDRLPESPSLPAPAHGGGANSTPFDHDGANMAFVWNHIFSPTVLTSTRLGWNRIYTTRRPPIDTNRNAELGLRGVNQTMAGAGLFNIAGVTSLGIGPQVPNTAESQSRQLVTDTTWTRGAHSIKFGTNFYWLQSHLTNPQQELGVFTFNGNFTRNPLGNAGGRPFADFLLGIPFQVQYSNSVYMNLRAPLFHFYVNDEWRATQRLTFNIGVRYEINRPWAEKNNLISNFDIDTDPANPQWRVAGDGNWFDRATIKPSYLQFAPRFGFAYQATGRTVLRGGYGLYFPNIEGTGGAEFLENNPPFHLKTQISTDSIHPSVLLRNGVPEGILTPERAVSLRFSSFEREPSFPMSQQWNFNIQQQLKDNLMLEMGYYGAKANHLVFRWDANYALPGPGNINNRRRYNSAVYPGTSTVMSPLAAMFRHNFAGNSNYHSLQAKLEKRFSSGFTFLTSYIWSKTIGDVGAFAGAGNAPGTGANIQNPLNWRAERSLDNQHLAHRIVASYMYDLPFGHGRTWGSSSGRMVNALFGGWSVGGITTLASGQPASLTVRGDPANTGNVNRPNVVGNPHLGRDERTLNRYFNTSAFVPNDPFTYGNAGRNLLSQPGNVNFDFATHKRFALTESMAMQFRFEAFNLFNTPQFGSPNAEVGNVNFGRITSAGRPRNLQLGLKLIF